MLSKTESSTRYSPRRYPLQKAQSGVPLCVHKFPAHLEQTLTWQRPSGFLGKSFLALRSVYEVMRTDPYPAIHYLNQYNPLVKCQKFCNPKNKIKSRLIYYLVLVLLPHPHSKILISKTSEYDVFPQILPCPLPLSTTIGGCCCNRPRRACVQWLTGPVWARVLWWLPSSRLWLSHPLPEQSAWVRRDNSLLALSFKESQEAFGPIILQQL